MPQFQPWKWLNMLTWLILLFSLILVNIHLNKLPNILKLLFIRIYLLFTLPLK